MEQFENNKPFQFHRHHKRIISPVVPIVHPIEQSVPIVHVKYMKRERYPIFDTVQ